MTSKMTSLINEILIIGATSGIGEAFARRFHGQGKKVIITGRRADRLQQLAQELPGLHTYQWDISDLTTLSQQASAILEAHPTLDTVFLNAGIEKSFSFLDPTSISDEDAIIEVNTNLTAQILLTRVFIPHLVSVAEAEKKATNLLITSSSLSYLPLSFYPIYCATKAGIHALCISLRQQLSFAPSEIVREKVNVVEIVPPYTDTGLDANHRAAVIAIQGGPEKALAPMPLDEYIEQAFRSLETLDEQGRPKKEVGVGFGQIIAETWRGSIGSVLEGMGLSC